MDGLVMVRLRLAGVTPVSSSTSFLALDEVVVAVSKRLLFASGVLGRAETGRVGSSTEKMLRSSPFHWSPLSWSFCR